MTYKPKPTLFSKIATAIFKRFRNPYYTYTFRLPIPCCEWCRSEWEINERKGNELEERLMQMEHQVQGLEKRFKSNKTEAFALKMEVAMKLLDHVMDTQLRQDNVFLNPMDITRTFGSAYEVVDKLVSRSTAEDIDSDEELAFCDSIREAFNHHHSSRLNGYKS